MSKIFLPKHNEDPLELLKRCGGYYECPKDGSGKRLGPLVGYAGKYGPYMQKKQYVGDVFANFARLERYPAALLQVAQRLGMLVSQKIEGDLFDNLTGFCGAPLGGLALATILAQTKGVQYGYPEKVVTALKTETSREESALRFDRHTIEPETSWIITEDVCNNFSTTADLVRLIMKHGGLVLGIACFLNRSLAVEDEFKVDDELTLPVIALVRKPIDQWEQEDPAVADDVAAGNVIWKPKNDWQSLEIAMAQAA